MRKWIISTVLMLVFHTSPSCSPLSAKRMARWLLGCWASTNLQEKKYGECWQKISYQTKGISFQILHGDTTFLETVVLAKSNGKWTFVPVTNGQNDNNPIVFTLTVVADNKFVFTNPDHDFPKRIVYHFLNRQRLHAYVDDGTDANRLDFFYSKQKLASP